MSWITERAKAIAAAVVGFAAAWVQSKFGFSVSPEVEAAIVGALMMLVVYFVPNSAPTT